MCLSGTFGTDPYNPNRYHKTTYLEWEIPVAIEKECGEFISKAWNNFEKTCKCDMCKETRREARKKKVKK